MSNPDVKNGVQVISDHDDAIDNSHQQPVPVQISENGGGPDPVQNRGVRRGFGYRPQPYRNRPAINQGQGQWKRERDLHNSNMNGGGGSRGGRQGGQQQPPRKNDDRLLEKLELLSGPTYDLAPLDTTERKFSVNNRLYVGNIPNETTEQEFIELFDKYGEVSDVFLNTEKSFAFIKLDYHCNAEKAKRELDGFALKGRFLRIRYAPNASTVKVKNLSAYVTNELLHAAFSVFGDIERAVIIVDDRGKSTGEGVIDFVRKGSALLAVRKCSEACFFLTASLQPAIVEAYEALHDCDGLPEKNINKRSPVYLKEREVGPRFANISSFEHEFGMRWKQLHESHAQKEAALKKELELEREKLELQMDYARYEHETEVLRDQLRARELDKERQKREWEMRERQVDEARQRAEEMTRKQQQDMEARIMRQEEEMRRRQQENSLFMQAHQLDNNLDQQEQKFEVPNRPPPPLPVGIFERGNRFDGPGMGRVNGNGMGGHWVNEGHDNFQNKRRRF